MKFIILNWKLFPENEIKAIDLVSLIYKDYKMLDLRLQKKYRIIVCPPYIFIPPIYKFLSANKYQNVLYLGGQNVFYRNRGAFTGTISPVMLKSYNIKYCIVGHSECKTIFKETNIDINNKIKSLLKQKIKPIICVGENKRKLKETSSNFRIKNEIFGQLNEYLKGIPIEEAHNLMIAYEPVWAISQNTPTYLPNPQDTKNIIHNIRFWLSTRFNGMIAQNIPILYGGSVNHKNMAQYLEISNGILVGSASVQKAEITKLIKNLI